MLWLIDFLRCQDYANPPGILAVDTMVEFMCSGTGIGMCMTVHGNYTTSDFTRSEENIYLEVWYITISTTASRDKNNTQFMCEVQGWCLGEAVEDVTAVATLIITGNDITIYFEDLT